MCPAVQNMSHAGYHTGSLTGCVEGLSLRLDTNTRVLCTDKGVSLAKGIPCRGMGTNQLRQKKW